MPEAILKAKACPECNYTFKVYDTNNWVCTKCYARELPKYVRKRIKHVKGRFEQFAIKDDELTEMLISEASVADYEIDPDEKAYVEYLCKTLRDGGITDYDVNLECLTGIIDIYIPAQRISGGSKGNYYTDTKIIEVKKNNSSTNMKSALGQLLFYSSAHPEALLFVATPKPLPREYKEIFKLYEVEEWV